MNKIYIVKEKTDLTTFLINFISKKDVKRLLINKKIIVNGRVINKYNYLLNKGDEVVVNLAKSDLTVLYEDKFLLIVDKPHNLISIATETSKKSLYNQVSEYVKIRGKNNKIFIVNRLDKDTSGIVVFSKDEKTKHLLQDNWENVRRKYLAIVSGETNSSGVIKNYLLEDNNLHVKSVDPRKYKDAKLAITEYKRLKKANDYTWLDIEIKTGRKNQIRVHMNDINCFIVGDTKYGGSKERRMFLHAYKIIFNHPITNKEIEVSATIPSDFKYRF